MVTTRQNSLKISRASGANFKRILVAVDGSENSTRATAAAVAVAERYGSEIIVLNVILGRTYDQFKTVAEKKAREIVDREVEVARGRGVKARWEVLPSADSIVGQIVDYADREKADLIAMGSRGIGGFKRMIIGSVSSGVLTHARCPVLVVR